MDVLSMTSKFEGIPLAMLEAVAHGTPVVSSDVGGVRECVSGLLGRCLPLEAADLRRLFGPAPILVTPGVRSAGANRGDQKRVATPAEALRDGATYLVIGRQVTRAADPAGEVARLLEEIGGAGPRPA